MGQSGLNLRHVDSSPVRRDIQIHPVARRGGKVVVVQKRSSQIFEVASRGLFQRGTNQGSSSAKIESY